MFAIALFVTLTRAKRVWFRVRNSLRQTFGSKQAFPFEAPVCFIADNDMVEDIDAHNFARLR